jgi:hypothetical protein
MLVPGETPFQNAIIISEALTISQLHRYPADFPYVSQSGFKMLVLILNFEANCSASESAPLAPPDTIHPISLIL